MPTTLELLDADKIFLLRSGAAHRAYGDPYTLSAACLVTGRAAEIKGGYGQLLDIRGLKAAVRAQGIELVTWERCLSGVLIPHTLRITKE